MKRIYSKIFGSAVTRALRAATLAAATSLVAATAYAQPAVLRFATGVPDTSPIVTEVLEPWAEMMNEEGGEHFQIEVTNGVAIANPSNMWERVEQGIVDIGWSLHGSSGLPFPKTAVASLPFLYQDIVAASSALWRLYESDLISDEYEGVHVLALTSLPIQGISANKPVNTLSDMEGLKVRAVDKVAADTVLALGGAPISIPTQEVYQSLDRGVVDAAVVNWLMVGGFRVGEVAPNHQRGISLGGVPGFLVMNQSVYEGLSPEAQQALDSAAGGTSSEFLGEHYEQLAADIEQTISNAEGQQVLTLSSEERAQWESRLQSVVDSWVADTPDGEQILEQFRAELNNSSNQ